jgi:hypothetical protein
VSYSPPIPGANPGWRLSSSRDFRFTLGGFHALLAPQTRCFSAFPYGTFALSITTLSYLALDGQHHPYSASTFELTYSREGSHVSPGSICQVAFNALCPCLIGNHPRAADLPVGEPPIDYRSRRQLSQRDSVSG